MSKRKAGPRPVVVGTCTLAPFQHPEGNAVQDAREVLVEEVRREQPEHGPHDHTVPFRASCARAGNALRSSPSPYIRRRTW